MKRLLIFCLCLLMSPPCNLAFAAPPERVNTYNAGETILSDAVTENEDTIFNYLQAGVDTIKDNTIVNADVNSAANIQSDKLNLTSVAQNVLITSSGSLEVDGTSTFDGTADFNGNTTFAGVTIADLGTVTTANIDGGTIDGITSLTAGGNLDIGAYNLRAATLTADGLTSGRVVFATTNGQLTDDSDLSFSTDTLTATKIAAFTLSGKLTAGAVEIEGSGFDINGGAIDGVTIGGASAPTVTDLGTVTTCDINGGTVNGITSLGLSTGTDITEISIDGTMGGNSDNAVPTEQAVVEYVVKAEHKQDVTNSEEVTISSTNVYVDTTLSFSFTTAVTSTVEILFALDHTQVGDAYTYNLLRDAGSLGTFNMNANGTYYYAYSDSALAAGTYTYKIQVKNTSGTNNPTISGFLQAIAISD